MSGLHFIADSHTQPTGIYAQEQWTLGRLTLQGGIRFDRATSGYPGSAARARAVHPDAHAVPGAGWDRLQRHLAEIRRRLRSARQRQDGGQVHRRPLPRGVQRGGHLLRTQPDQPALDVARPARGPMPTATIGPTATCSTRRSRTFVAPAVTSVARGARRTSARTSSHRATIPISPRAGACVRTTGTSARP